MRIYFISENPLKDRKFEVYDYDVSDSKVLQIIADTKNKKVLTLVIWVDKTSGSAHSPTSKDTFISDEYLMQQEILTGYWFRNYLKSRPKEDFSIY